MISVVLFCICIWLLFIDVVSYVDGSDRIGLAPRKSSS